MWWSGRNKPEKIISTIKMPNGANWYLLDKKTKNLTKSYEPLSFPFLQEENEMNELIKRLNIELTSPNSHEKPVYALIINKKGELTPIAKNTFQITAPHDSNRWNQFKSVNFTQPLTPYGEGDDHNRIKLTEYDVPTISIVSPYFQNEPNISILAFPWLKSEIEAEYVCKAGFIEACLNNQWLIPYANRLGWRFVNGNASIIIPHWKDEDLSAWNNIKYTKPSTNGFLMSNGKRYPYPPNIKIEIPNVIDKGNGLLKLENEEFKVDDALFLEYPQTNRNQKNVVRILKEIKEGLIPFNPPYPITTLKDADLRVKANLMVDLTLIYLEPNKIIIGKHSVENYEKALTFYKNLWERGELLTEFGHVNYTDSYTELDERSIILLNLKDNQLF